MEDRLQKILSAAGVCSRRPGGNLHTTGPGHSERPARSPGGTADPDRDQIALDGVPVGRRGDHRC